MELVGLAAWCFVIALTGRLSEERLLQAIGVVLIVAAVSMVVEAVTA